MAKAMEPFKPVFFEEPTSLPNDPEDLKAVAASTSIPISTGEHFETIEQAASALSSQAIGLRSEVTARPHVDWVVAAQASYMHHRYGDRYAVGLPHRKDTQASLELSARYLLTREWSISGHVYRWRQSSNIALHSVGQTAYWLKLRYEYN